MSESIEELGMNDSLEGDGLLAEGVRIANIPTLLMVLVQLTGDTKWLREPYRPVRPFGLGDNDSGGLPEGRQAEVRGAALGAILEWRAGRPIAIAEPSSALLVEMLACAMNEEVAPEYGPLIAAQLGQRRPACEPIAAPAGFSVLIIGAGVSGMCAAVNLQAAGVPFTIIERNATVGGTWLENRYPGAGVDTPNHLYSYSFLTYDWTKYFALRDELWAYLEHVADSFSLRDHTRFNSEVLSARYDPEAQDWVIQVRQPDGVVRTERATVVISATGIFNPPKYPEIEGLDVFDGPVFHTALWPDDLSLAGKRVAIIGSGASCMQVGPEIQPQVAALTVFQRSPQWAAPFELFRKDVPPAIRSLLRDVPIYQSWYRARLAWTFNDRLHPVLQKDPDWPFPERAVNATMDSHRQHFERYLRTEIGERTDLLPQVLPTYPPYGKRILLDNGWFRMLTKPNVELVTERVARIEADALVTGSGERYPADVIVLATGFEVQRFLTAFDVVGRSGRTLREIWDDDDARAYLGLAIPDVPNFFCLYGPNTQHGGSLIFAVEMQMHYIMDLLRKMIDRGIGSIECRQDVHDRYNEGVDAAHEQMVWTHPGMDTYYRNSRGRVVVNYPYRIVDMFTATRQADIGDYVTESGRDRNFVAG